MQSFGHKAAFYHASMDSDERNHVQRRWSKDEISIICATVAFGMGNYRLAHSPTLPGHQSKLGSWVLLIFLLYVFSEGKCRLADKKNVMFDFWSF
jgi:hypothetical protein